MRLSTLERGCHGTQVELLQQLLNNTVHPHPLLVLDGEFGPKTGAAVRRFQTLKHLETDEVVGRQSWAALGVKPAEMPNPMPKPAMSIPPISSNSARHHAARFTAAQPLAVARPAVLHKPVQRRRVPLSNAPPVMPTGDARWMKVASAELGIHERTHDGTKRILEYHSATSLHAHSDQVAWCSSFVNWCLKQVGIAGTNNAAAASWAHWGKQLGEPRYGAIIQLHHASRGHDGRTGSSSGNHVAFFLKQDAGHVELLGGNQSDSVKVSRFPLATYHMAAIRWPR